MATVDLTTSTFTETVQSSGIVFVDFWAAWCGPCKTFAPIYENVSNEHADIVFAKVDTEAETHLSAQFGITSIPTLMVFRDGILVYSQPGALRAPQLNQLIQGARDLDMDDVRRQLAEKSTS